MTKCNSIILIDLPPLIVNEDFNETLEIFKKKIDIKKLSKESLIKIIELNDDISEKNLIEEIVEKAKKLEKGIQQEVFTVKLNNLYTQLAKKSYDSKFLYEDFTLYNYNDHTDIYCKKITEENLKKIITDIKKDKKIFDIWTYDQKKKRKFIDYEIGEMAIKKIMDINEKTPILKIQINFKLNEIK